MNQDKTFLGTEPVGKLLFRLAIPTVVAQLVNMLYNIVDRIYIGHMPGDGSLALTGVGVCMPLIMIITAFSCFAATGGAPRASISMGKGDHGTAEKLLGVTREVATVYNNPNTSGLTAVIKDGETNVIELNVGEKVEEEGAAL